MQRTATTILLLLLLAALCGCDRYPSQLRDEEQVQALIFEHLAANVLQRSSAGEGALLLFLCYAVPGAAPAQAVQDHVARSFRSVRPCSAAARNASGRVCESGTGRAGVELRLEAVTLSGDGPLTIRAATFHGPKHAEGFDYRVQRVKGRWKILGREQRWQS